MKTPLLVLGSGPCRDDFGQQLIEGGRNDRLDQVRVDTCYQCLAFVFLLAPGWQDRITPRCAAMAHPENPRRAHRDYPSHALRTRYGEARHTGDADECTYRCRVAQQRAAPTKGQIQERLLVVGARRLAQNECIGVVGVHLQRRRTRAHRSARVHARRQHAVVYALCRSRVSRCSTCREHDGDGHEQHARER